MGVLIALPHFLRLGLVPSSSAVTMGAGKRGHPGWRHRSYGSISLPTQRIFPMHHHSAPQFGKRSPECKHHLYVRGEGQRRDPPSCTTGGCHAQGNEESGVPQNTFCAACTGSWSQVTTAVSTHRYTQSPGLNRVYFSNTPLPSHCQHPTLLPTPAHRWFLCPLVLQPLKFSISMFQGNDQIRFELTCYSLAPQIKVRWSSFPMRSWALWPEFPG